MKLMETWVPYIDSTDIFSYRDILNIRILYANKLFFYSQNETDLSLVTDFYATVHIYKYDHVSCYYFLSGSFIFFLLVVLIQFCIFVFSQGC